MKRVLEITKQGYVFHVDAHAVAHDRATYYAEKDKDTTYQDEYNFTMGDDYELSDWYQNNMGWGKIPSDQKKMVKSPPPVSSPDDIEDADEDIDLKEIES